MDKKGVPVFKMPHEECGSSDALQVFDKDGALDGFCFSCGKYVPDPLENKPNNWTPPEVKIKSDEEVAAELADITENYSTFAHDERKLVQRALAYFDVKHAVSTSDGVTVTGTYFPYTKNGEVVRYKVKTTDKFIYQIGREKGWEPFGWKQALAAGGKTLYITEGEHDAVALYQAYKRNNHGTQWADIDPAVISVTNGCTGAVKEITEYLSEIQRRWKEVVIAFDMDEPGRKAAGELARLVGGTVADLPAKDPNQCLIEGRHKALYAAIRFNNKPPENTRLVRGSSLREAARQEAEWGMPWPWKHLNDATRGRRRGETIYFGAGVKLGKSELVNAIAKQVIVDDGLPCLLIKPEEAMGKTYQKIVGKVAGKIFHDPKIPFDYDAFDKAEVEVGDKAIITDVYQFVDWDTTVTDIKYAVNVWGVKDVIIDPITCFTNHLNPADANTFLMKMASELSALAKDLDFTAYIFCHLKAPESGDGHEQGGAVKSHQFAGSRAMMRSCNYMMGLEGNKDPDLPEDERNMRTIVLLEDREFGNTGKFPLFWDKNTGLFNEVAMA